MLDYHNEELARIAADMTDKDREILRRYYRYCFYKIIIKKIKFITKLFVSHTYSYNIRRCKNGK